MPFLTIPESGVTIGGSSSKNGSPAMEILGLTLADSVIEEMIRCVQNGKPIQLSLGNSPTISYGSKFQRLSSSEDPFNTELFSTDLNPNGKMASIKAQSHNLFGPLRPRLYKTGMVDKSGKEIRKPVAASTPILSATPGTDAGLAALQQAMASETLKKQENTTRIIKDGAGLPLPGKKGAKATKSRFPSQNRSLNSLPSSPALSGVGSPALAPTSIPLSQTQAELAKAVRKPVIHLLAAQPWTEIALREEVSLFSKTELKEALEKVGDLNTTTGNWELRRAFYKELDVWNFDYPSDSDRRKAIDNAVKSFDKQRLATSEPQWEKLMPPHERGTGKCLSKLQAQIANGPIQRAPKINVTKANDSGRDTPGGEDDGSVSDRNISKPKKPSAGEAQAKRLLSKKPLKPAAKPAPAKKAATSAPKVGTKAGSKVLSSEYVQDSGSDDDHYRAPVKPLNKPAQKRRRDEDVETSDSSIPLAKKAKETAPPHRVSDASQTSRTTNSSKNSSTGSSKNESNSPQKSSPLASSPPTNASDLDDQSSGERTSSSASPPRLSTKNSRSPIHKRHGKSSSVSSSTSSTSSRYLRPEVTDIARKYRLYYPKYAELHQELSTMKGKRDKAKEQSLLEMHARLEQMKKDILAGIVDGDSS